MHTQTTIAFMALELQNSTMAAGLKPILRASVNAVRGRAFGRHMPTAKGGNAKTQMKGLRRAAVGPGGGLKAARSQDRTGQDRTHDKDGF